MNSEETLQSRLANIVGLMNNTISVSKEITRISLAVCESYESQRSYGFPVVANVVTVAATRIAAATIGDVETSLAVNAFTAALHILYAV